MIKQHLQFVVYQITKGGPRLKPLVFNLLLILNIFTGLGHSQLIETQPLPDLGELSGFRVGATAFLISDTKEGRELDSIMKELNIKPIMSQFGYQFEFQRFTGKGRTAAVSEFIILAGGLEQGLIVPSVTWIIGFRLDNGFEFGGGPNLSLLVHPNGFDIELTPAFVWGAGYSLKTGRLIIPLNAAIAHSRQNIRTTFLTGFVF